MNIIFPLKIPIIIITNTESKDRAEIHQQLETSADDYVTKPIIVDDFVDKIDQLIGLADELDLDVLTELSDDNSDEFVNDSDEKGRFPRS